MTHPHLTHNVLLHSYLLRLTPVCTQTESCPQSRDYSFVFGEEEDTSAARTTAEPLDTTNVVSIVVSAAFVLLMIIAIVIYVVSVLPLIFKFDCL